MIISEKIFCLLDQKGITQKDFAVQTGISQSTISDWKRKKTNPSADKILKICEILHVTPYELLSERDEAIINNIDHLVALNDEEAVVLEGFRNLEKRKKERFLGYLAVLQSEDNGGCSIMETNAPTGRPFW